MSRRRILIAEYLHEICSFNPVPTRYSDFFVNFGARVLEYHHGAGTEVSGALEVLQARPEVEIVPTFSARGITSGGTIPDADFERIEDEWATTLREAGPVDAAYFALHGATAAESEPDPEGRLLEIARQILGESIPIVASFDLHGVLTNRMLEHCDAITVYHTYPHVDFFETGSRAAKLLLRILDREIHPIMAKVEIPALVRGDELITETGLFGRLINSARELEQRPEGLAAGFFIGNPFTDVPELRTYAVVVTDNAPEIARREAEHLSAAFWAQRHLLQARLTPLRESVQQALVTTRPVALVDAADATSSGASGDSAAILQELLHQNCARKTLVPLVDPCAVEAAFQAGIGATIDVNVGGAFDRKRFRPVAITGTVRSLSDGRFRSESFGQEWAAGRTAVFERNPFTLVISSRPVHLFDRSLFFAHGQDPRNFEITIVKSPHCQRHMYADWCEMINVDAPGSTSANLQSLGHVNCRRPVFPLDDGLTWEPAARLFSRGR